MAISVMSSNALVQSELLEHGLVKKRGLRIFRWTARLMAGIPTNHSSAFLVDGARFLVSFIVGCWPVSNKNSSQVGNGMLL